MPARSNWHEAQPQHLETPSDAASGRRACNRDLLPGVAPYSLIMAVVMSVKRLRHREFDAARCLGRLARIATIIGRLSWCPPCREYELLKALDIVGK